jgi:sec-independent protein translocase protein TatA
MNLPLAFDFVPNPVEMIVIGVIAVLLFGKRLPEVGRSFGQKIAEVRKQIRSIEEAIHSAGTSIGAVDVDLEMARRHPEDVDEATAPKFEPPPPLASEGPSPPSTPGASTTSASPDNGAPGVASLPAAQDRVG